MKNFFTSFAVLFSLSLSLGVFSAPVNAQTARPRVVRTATPTASASATPTATPIETVVPATNRPDITQRSEESVGPLEKLTLGQNLGPVWTNPLKHLVRSSIHNGVPANTLVLLLLLPLVAAFVAAARQIFGLQGFGLLLPTALSIAFLAVGPVVGIGLFLVIVATSIFGRGVLKRVRLRLHYLPRMSLLLALTVLCLLLVLFLGSAVNLGGIANISIFPVLFLVVLSEDFTRVQLGKSFKIALNITTQTLFLALTSYFFLTLWDLQRFAIMHPELLMGGVILGNIILGKFSGLRVLEYWRFRKLIRK